MLCNISLFQHCCRYLPCLQQSKTIIFVKSKHLIAVCVLKYDSDKGRWKVHEHLREIFINRELEETLVIENDTLIALQSSYAVIIEVQ